MIGLAEVLGARGRRAIYLVGSGGKTTTLYALAHELAGQARVVTTTSTRIARPSPEQSPSVLIAADVTAALCRLSEGLRGPGHATLVRAVGADGKLHGHSLAQFDTLHRSDAVDVWLVEADGSAGRPLKAHAAYEPVVWAAADLVIAVVGAAAVGRPLNDAWVHRSAIARERLGREAGAVITAEDVARLVLHPQGYLRGAPGEVTVLITGAGADRDAATALARVIAAADERGRVARLAIGDLIGPRPWVEQPEV